MRNHDPDHLKWVQRERMADSSAQIFLRGDLTMDGADQMNDDCCLSPEVNRCSRATVEAECRLQSEGSFWCGCWPEGRCGGCYPFECTRESWNEPNCCCFIAGWISGMCLSPFTEQCSGPCGCADDDSREQQGCP